MNDYPEKQVAIVGAGQSEVGRPSPHSPLKLTVDASLRAIEDAGLTTADIDGLVVFPGGQDTGDGYGPTSTTEAVAALGVQPHWIAASVEGHSHMGSIFAAIHAIASGDCRNVLVFRTVAQASARARVHHAGVLGGGNTAAPSWGWQSWNVPYGALSTAPLFALYAQAYLDRYGATEAQLGAIAVHGRKMAALNPNAIYRDKPLSLDDYLAGRMISSPLRLYDCDSHVDGSTAIVLSHRDLARGLRQRPLVIEAMGRALAPIGRGAHAGDFTSLPAAEETGRMLWSRTDLKPSDMQFAQLYDGFSIHVLMWLEGLGFVPKGEGLRFLEGGARVDLDGELPLNTSGGQLSAGRFHGFGHIYEACLQLWGKAGRRQVRDAEVGLVSNGGFGVGALVLRRD